MTSSNSGNLYLILNIEEGGLGTERTDLTLAEMRDRYGPGWAIITLPDERIFKAVGAKVIKTEFGHFFEREQ